jgi:hypothetical protein
MKKKIGEWLKVNNVLEQLLGYDLSGTLALRAAMAQEAIADKLKAFEKKRNDLFQKYGEEGEQAGTLHIPAEKMEEFGKEFQPLVDMEVNISIEKIPRKEIEATEGVKGTLIRNLLPLIGE